ncbi:predicted Zn-dependent hydrolase of beta-lactamase fold [Chthonomonas calidirosea]|uniref:UPF0173 metal-dependent hydrolase CCALI_00455 n=1 Tax=Chthonomonas calidirosea (strain DSM 23976 / ICMP 18418 / T49) TaxID=1303518 RepID=S0ESP7_CHTCT|nr:metal-dependent hydrolase [Chthonomonas calidirosea]CCW34289.1 Predicted Zn-dependent hydrolases of the beta-lactamase fold [Chthonomonas calidirosea T49]CEK15204.1 predicted Zn-dependent hydrolase of beta-lactamase fold [Chthonomonas calidirosea]
MLARDTAITFLGHATLLVETPGHKRLLIDPWLRSNPACPAEWHSPSRLGKLDAILVTHLHADHVADFEEVIQANPDATVVGIIETVRFLTKKGAKKTEQLNIGGSILFDGIRITLTQAVHSNGGEDAHGNMVYGGFPTGFILKMENGFTFYVASDTGVFGDMALLKEIYAPELAFLPIGDRFTMGPLEAAHATKLLGVRHVVPYHYNSMPMLTGTVEEFQKHLRELLVNVNVHILQPGETLK